MEKISANTNSLNWFELPVTDIARAKKFYETIMDVKLEQMDMNEMIMASFPGSDQPDGKVRGALVQSQWHTPSMDGAVVYLNANPNIQEVLDRIEPAGGKVLMPRTLINEHIGYMAFFADTEGNRVALHAGN